MAYMHINESNVDEVLKDLRAHNVDPDVWSLTGLGTMVLDVKGEKRYLEIYVAINETVYEVNKRLKVIADADLGEIDTILIEALGINYEPVSVEMWTLTKNSSAEACFTVMQVPSAEMMKFDCGIEFLQEYMQILRVICNNYDIDVEI